LISCVSSNIEAQINQVMSYNIRFNNPADGINQWDNRKSEVVDLLRHYEPSIFGLQEALQNQLDYLDENLKAFSRIGVGRDDGMEKGEFSAIYYKHEEWKVLKEETFWLSPTYSKISVGWDASMERICTYGIFENNINKQKIMVLNAHYDHIGKIARVESSKLILNRIAEINKDDIPVILLGDFNALPEQASIKFFTEEFGDASVKAENGIYGPKGTFSGFHEGSIPHSRIDFIFVKDLFIKKYTHVDDRMKNGNHLSDHIPVLVEFEF